MWNVIVKRGSFPNKKAASEYAGKIGRVDASQVISIRLEPSAKAKSIHRSAGRGHP